MVCLAVGNFDQSESMSHELLRRIGFFVDAEFLDAERVKQIIVKSASGAGQPAGVISGGESVVDTTVRLVDEISMPIKMQSYVRSRLDLLKPLLEKHFKTTLQGAEDPVCLAYRAGSFYKPHRDVSSNTHDPEFVRHRSITAIVFLNAETENGAHGSYSGGSVAFYGVMKFPGWEDYGVSLKGREGLLVAFPSDTLHEVQPVTAGTRSTIVTWFYR
jgi:predicted 2-oxoglutarate/Fe(II)-dependent dioxygenase YbiX